MSDSEAFTIVCDHLERATGLERPAARGTVRLALKEAGLDSESVTPEQMSVVTEKILPSELQALNIGWFCPASGPSCRRCGSRTSRASASRSGRA